MKDLSDRHEATRHALKLLEPNSRLDGAAFAVATLFYQTALNMVGLCDDGPELTVALRHLWDGKNCAVMQALLDAGL